ncbi:MAG: chromosome segregation protein SMC [Chloroflexota bacterium]
MRLKSLEIQGFKSFANKSIYQFDHGVTAIVGPNGSGKSNIADAIRWVLGEQSYNNLRAQKTVDMIFSGSTNRARMGMAYVSLVLDNSDGTLPLDYNEVTISRRAYRSGENEYLVNNNKMRLKDIAEILAKGGLARQTYTLVGQGTIDRALSLRSSERRQLFEEAAGITYHRHRRAETLRRLDETHQNLLRVNDIVQEIEPRLKRLSRQAEKVEDFEKIRRHLDGLLKVWYGYLWKQGQQRLHHSRVRDTIGQERLLEEQEVLAEIEGKVSEIRQQQTEVRGQLGDWHAESSKLHAQAEAIQRELAVGEERSHQLTAQREEHLGEIQTLEKTLEDQETQVSKANQTLSEFEADYQAAQKVLKDIEQKLAQHRTERETQGRILKQAEEKARQLAKQQTEHQSRLTQRQERLTELQAQEKTTIEIIEQLTQEKETLDEQRIQVKNTLESLQTDETSLGQTQNQKRQTQQELIETNKTLTQRLNDVEKVQASLQARQDVLSKLRTEMAGYHSGVKEILQTDTLAGVRGTVAQLIKVPSNLEAAIEAGVGGRLQEIIVDTWSDADQAIDHLKQTKTGRATFLPLNTLRAPEALSVPNSAGVIGLATELVEFDPAIEPAAKSLFNRLLIVEDLSAAKRAFETMKGSFQIVTQAGEMVRSGGSVTGGKARQQQSGFLAREREWRELPDKIAQAEQRITAAKQAITENQTTQTELQRELTALADRKNTLSKTIQTTLSEFTQLNSNYTDKQNQITWQEKNRTESLEQIAQYQAQQGELEQMIKTIGLKLTDEEAHVTALQEIVAGLSGESLQNEFNQAQNTVALTREKRRNQQTLKNSFADNVTQTQSRLAHRRARIAELATQRETLRQQLDTQEGDHQALLETVQTFVEKIEPAQAKLTELETSQTEQENTETQQRGQIRRLESDASRFALELAREQDKMQQLQQQIEDDFGLVQLDLSDDQVGQPVLPLSSLVTQLPTVDELPEQIEEDIQHLKIRIRQLGNVNPEAPKEYGELQERFDFLTGQMHDLEAAAQDLKAVIEELDRIMEAAFSETFSNVAKAFQHYFRILFDGGEAQLILTDPDNISETGIEIVARPPGKRSQNLELLSGGERSLTAQALIFSLLRTSPTPYVIFDEVDAMLDEANVDRFRKALLALSQDIQFIVITHNRKTIEVANTIYGIFMREGAVSEAVSLKLDDIAQDEAEQLSFAFGTDTSAKAA